jgi:hypothetical protein
MMALGVERRVHRAPPFSACAMSSPGRRCSRSGPGVGAAGPSRVVARYLWARRLPVSPVWIPTGYCDGPSPFPVTSREAAWGPERAAAAVRWLCGGRLDDAPAADALGSAGRSAALTGVPASCPPASARRHGAGCGWVRRPARPSGPLHAPGRSCSAPTPVCLACCVGGRGNRGGRRARRCLFHCC